MVLSIIILSSNILLLYIYIRSTGYTSTSALSRNRLRAFCLRIQYSISTLFYVVRLLWRFLAYTYIYRCFGYPGSRRGNVIFIPTVCTCAISRHQIKLVRVPFPRISKSKLRSYITFSEMINYPNKCNTSRIKCN